MQIIKFGTDNISKLSLGTVQFGLSYGVANKEGQPKIEAIQSIVDFVLREGINCFDTASDYGESEKILGKVLKERNTYLISKLKSENFTNNLKENLSDSLNRLNINSLYALLLHDSKLLYNWKDSYTKEIDSLIFNKKIKFFGVSIYTDEDFIKAIENDNINIIQVPFNIFDQRAISLSWFKKAKEKNKLIFIRSVYLQGLILMDRQELPNNLKDVEKYLVIFEKYCEEFNLSKNELALSYVNSIAKDSILLFGCDNLLQAKENIKTFNNLPLLSNEVINKINESFKSIPEYIYNPTKWKHV